MIAVEAKAMMEARLECLSRSVTGTDPACNYEKCMDCEVNYRQGTVGEQIEALTLVIAAIEKQIPQEPTETTWNTNAGVLRVCPVCKSAIARASSYCRVCGQAIKDEVNE
jgi:hypothetical protein